MLWDRGAGEAREDFMVSLKVDLGLSGGGVEGTLISEPGGPASVIAIVALFNRPQVTVGYDQSSVTRGGLDDRQCYR